MKSFQCPSLFKRRQPAYYWNCLNYPIESPQIWEHKKQISGSLQYGSESKALAKCFAFPTHHIVSDYISCFINFVSFTFIKKKKNHEKLLKGKESFLCKHSRRLWNANVWLLNWLFTNLVFTFRALTITKGNLSSVLMKVICTVCRGGHWVPHTADGTHTKKVHVEAILSQETLIKKLIPTNRLSRRLFQFP